MNAPHDLNTTPTDMTTEEWQARCDLAALYRIVDHFGWTDILATHMSVRVPGEPEAFLINHYEEMFHEITASSLIKMSMDGRVLGRQGRFNSAGLTIHSGVYKARPDVNCVMHTHTRAGAGVSLIRRACARSARTRCWCWTRWRTTTTACRPAPKNANRWA